jgi:hypothetical protein
MLRRRRIVWKLMLWGLVAPAGCAMSGSDEFILLPDSGTSATRSTTCGPGTPATGGTLGTGGALGSGGGSASGGTVATGGSAGAGGLKATGGTAGMAGHGAVGGMGGSGGKGGTGGSSTPTFKQIYQTILSVSCTGSPCHNPGVQSGVSFASPSSAYSAVKSRVIAGQAASSTFYTLVDTGRMPPGGQLSMSQLSMIAAWINAGALND